MASNQGLKWGFNSECRLHRRRWGEDCIIFNAASGQTHLLNELGAEILHCLQAADMTVAELGEQLATQYDLAVDEQLLTSIQDLVINMDELGLINPHTA